MKQNEITKPTKLLDSRGNVANPGWCRKGLYIYSRDDIKANESRIKEWNFYQISDERYTVQLTFTDISIGGGVTFVIFDRTTGERFEASKILFFTRGNMGLPEYDDVDHTLQYKTTGFDCRIEVIGNDRHITLDAVTKKGRMVADITVAVPERNEYLEMAVPFKEKKHFYLNKKMNCMNSSGFVKVGKRTMTLNSKNAFCVLDWGRGVWPHKCAWVWGNGSCFLPDGRLFGFEIGWGFGEMDNFTENCLFCDGRANKIGQVKLNYDPENLMDEWIFSSDDGRFNLTMVPEYDNHTKTGVPSLVGMECHQVHGKFSGTVVLDSGEVLRIKNMLAFCEICCNRW